MMTVMEGDDEDDGDGEVYDEYGTDYESDDGGIQSCDKNREETRLAPLTDGQLILCSATLKGYSLKNKKWLMFAFACPILRNDADDQ